MSYHYTNAKHYALIESGSKGSKEFDNNSQKLIVLALVLSCHHVEVAFQKASMYKLEKAGNNYGLVFFDVGPRDCLT